MPSSLVSKIRMGPAFRPFSTPGALTVLGRIGDSRDSGIAGAAFASKGAELRPAVRGPINRGELELRRAAVGPVVIMVGEHLAVRGFHGLLPAGANESAGRGEHERAAALSHVPAVPVAIGALDAVRPADANVVGRGHALAALVEADEEVELPLVLEDRGGLDRPSVAACERKGRRIVANQPAGRRIELPEFDARPERPE